MDNLYKLYISLGEPEGPIFHPEKLEEWAYNHINHLQWKIDNLMLEFCPDEMTTEQLNNWAQNQLLAEEW